MAISSRERNSYIINPWFFRRFDRESVPSKSILRILQDCFRLLLSYGFVSNRFWTATVHAIFKFCCIQYLDVESVRNALFLCSGHVLAPDSRNDLTVLPLFFSFLKSSVSATIKLGAKEGQQQSLKALHQRINSSSSIKHLVLECTFHSFSFDDEYLLSLVRVLKIVEVQHSIDNKSIKFPASLRILHTLELRSKRCHDHCHLTYNVETLIFLRIIVLDPECFSTVVGLSSLHYLQEAYLYEDVRVDGFSPQCKLTTFLVDDVLDNFISGGVDYCSRLPNNCNIVLYNTF
ncbi:hypothetical protein RCL1_000518 [Eukaryota sp. TZLM3-RCL]